MAYVILSIRELRRTARIRVPGPGHGGRAEGRGRVVDKPEGSGYIMARMRYEIHLSPEAAQDLKRLKAHARAEAKDALERHLRHEPGKVSKRRIKRLRGLAHPQYRLMVGEIRVFYDITGGIVEVLAIVPKSETPSWLEEWGSEQ